MRSILAVWLVLASLPAFAADACDAQIPSALKVQIEEAFPRFRTPVTTDNLAEDVEWDRSQGRKGCLGIAQADFDGDGATDFLFGLTEREGPGGVVVAALSSGDEWQFHQLGAWAEGRSRLYVGIEKPGTYWRTAALDGPLAAGEVNPLECPNAVALYGAAESSAVAFCYGPAQWQYVWVSD